MDEEQRAAVPPRRPSERDALSRRIQRALEEEARLWGQEQFYSPLPDSSGAMSPTSSRGWSSTSSSTASSGASVLLAEAGFNQLGARAWCCTEVADQLLVGQPVRLSQALDQHGQVGC